MKLGRDEVLMVRHLCIDFLANFAQGWIQGGAKIGQRCCGSVRPCVVPSVRPCEDLVNTIETKPLHISLSNLADMLTMMRG